MGIARIAAPRRPPEHGRGARRGSGARARQRSDAGAGARRGRREGRRSRDRARPRAGRCCSSSRPAIRGAGCSSSSSSRPGADPRERQAAAASRSSRSGDLSDGNEQGLLGLAFHPRFADQRQALRQLHRRTMATRTSSSTRSARTPTSSIPRRARELIRIAQPYSNHNGGNLVFGPDGKLYIGMGDGGSAGDPHEQRPEPAGAARRRSCASTSMPRSPSPSSSTSACATRGGSGSIRRPAISTSATSARTCGRRSTSSRHGRHAPQLRLEHRRGHPLLRRRDLRPRRGFTRAGRRLLARRGLLGHRRRDLSRQGAAAARRALLLRRLLHGPVAQLPVAGRRRSASTGTGRPRSMPRACSSRSARSASTPTARSTSSS